jgi:hypothetical protein
MDLEVERVTILSLADHLLGRSLKQISPKQLIVTPLVAKPAIRSNKYTLLKDSANRSRSRVTRSNLLNLEKMTILCVVDTQFDRNLGGIFHMQWRPERHVLDVVGAQLNVNAKTVENIISLGTETVQVLALSVESDILDRVKTTAFQRNGDVVLV